MKIKLGPAASVLALALAGAAYAQQPPVKPETPAGSETAPTMTKPESAIPAPAPKSSAAGTSFIGVQKNGETLASELQGLSVKNAAGDSLGSVSDFVLDKQGKVIAVILGVGGFLGIGEKPVAVPFEALEMTTDKDGKKVATLSVTKEALQAAPRYMTAKAQKAAEEEAKARQERPTQPQRPELPKMPGEPKK